MVWLAPRSSRKFSSSDKRLGQPTCRAAAMARTPFGRQQQKSVSKPGTAEKNKPLKADRMTQATNGHGTSQSSGGSKPRAFEVRVLRQNGPQEPSYWERHRLELEPDMNVTSVLQRIAAQATTVEGERVAPVAYDANCLEEVCGSCTMLINGRTRQACSALVERLLD